MTETPIIDSNILISFFTVDKNYENSKKVIYENGGFYNEFILCETLNYIQNKYSHFHSMDAYNLMVKGHNTFFFLPIALELYSIASDIRNKYADNNYTMTDCLILAQAEQLGFKVYTADIRMQNYKAVEVINPFT